MSQNDLKILITANLNVGKSIGDINTAIKGLERKVNKLKLKIEAPQDFQRSIQSFINATNKMKVISDEQNKVIREEIEEFKRLDGTIEKHIKQVKANGEVVQKQIKRHDDSKKAIEDERMALEDLMAEQSKFNKLKNVQDKFGANGKTTGSTRTYSDGNQMLRVDLDNEDKVIKYTITDRVETEKLIKTKEELRQKLVQLSKTGELSKKQLSEAARAVNTAYDDESLKKSKEIFSLTKDQQVQSLRWEKDRDRAHYDAFKEKEKREKHLHSLVLDRAEAEKMAYKDLERMTKSRSKTSDPIGTGATKLGTYDSLKKSGADYEDVKKVLQLTEAYKGLEIRETSLNTTTGKWTATLRANAKENLVLRGVIDKTNGSIYEQEKAIKMATAKNLGMMQQFKIAASRIPLWIKFSPVQIKLL